MSLRSMFRRASDSSSSSEEEQEDPSAPASDLADVTEYTSLSGITVRLHQERVRGIAHQLWPASIALVEYMERNLDTLFPAGIREQAFVELGAGIGLCGLFAAALGSRQVVLTDVPVAMDSLEHNIAINNATRARAAVLMWGDEGDFRQVTSMFEGPPFVIASDCVYWEHLYVPLFKTLLSFVNHGSTILMAHVKRWKKDTKFFAMCVKHMKVETVLERVDHKVVDESLVSRRIIHRIYRMSKLV